MVGSILVMVGPSLRFCGVHNAPQHRHKHSYRLLLYISFMMLNDLTYLSSRYDDVRSHIGSLCSTLGMMKQHNSLQHTGLHLSTCVTLPEPVLGQLSVSHC